MSHFLPEKNEATVFISVVIPARNEEKNIIPLLLSLANQTYLKKDFEVIIIDDFSTDGTYKAVVDFPLPNIKLIQPNVAAQASSKKKAIEAAIEIASGELIVATDADCLLPPDWLQTIADFYTITGAVFIAAPVKFTYNNSVLQRFQAIDFLVLQGITAASVASGFHAMCNGANLAYTKNAFINVDGFTGIDQVASGDDMLLMHKIWKRHPGKVQYLKSKNAIVQTAPMPTWKEFFWQRIRWASKTTHYNDKRIFWVLLFTYFVNVLFVVLLIGSFFNSNFLIAALFYWIIKTGVEIPFIYSVAKFYNEKKLLFYFFFFQPLHAFYTVSIGLLSQMGSYNWKGRRTK